MGDLASECTCSQAIHRRQWIQGKLAASAVERRDRARNGAFILAGPLHDDVGNHMSPSHVNKRGVRYRY